VTRIGPRSRLTILAAAKNGNNEGGDDDEVDRSFDEFLDTPFYDPDRVLENEDSSETSKRIANWIKGDYETAETLIAGTFFVVLIIIAQEIVRMQMYGDSYVPFSNHGGGGKLF